MFKMNEEKRTMYTMNHLRDVSKEDWQAEDRPKLVTIPSVRDQAKLFEETLCKLTL